MTIFKTRLRVLAALLLAAVALGLWINSRDQAQAARVGAALETARVADPPRYDPAMVADLPEVTQRGFARAIDPGTPLHRVVRLEMEGSFILNGTEMPMTAPQILAPPARGFVWQAAMGQRLMRFAGSDGYHAPEGGAVESWTKFWLMGAIALARIVGSTDHARAAATRVMPESIWATASLLPQFGAQWVQTRPDFAEVRFAGLQKIEPMQITLDAAGNPGEVWALRWTDANPERVHRLQPFGGRMLKMTRHEGFLIPQTGRVGHRVGHARICRLLSGPDHAGRVLT